jgi:hypothetical protein
MFATQMKAGTFLSVSLFMAAVLAAVLTGPGCANIVPPGGGPRDSLPPVLISASPKDSGTFVTSQKIVLNFDEFVELKSPNEKVLVAPYPKQSPQIEYKLRTVTIRLKDSLLPNTTYVIDFGEAIADLNESNLLRNFRYVFSTGSQIDTNELRGNIILAETGKTDSTMFALLYRNEEDSTVAKENPPYVARVNGKGQFRFTNLPSGTYYVYGLLDADGNKKYNQPIETFAFLDTPLVVNGNTPAVTLYAFATEKEKKRTSVGSGGGQGQIRKLIYTTNLKASAQDLLDTLVLTYNKPLKQTDTSKIRLIEDSVVQKPIQLINDTARNKMLLLTSWKPGSKYDLFLDKEYATDTSGLTSSANDTLRFRARQEEEYGSIRLRFKNVDTSLQPVLLFYNGDQLEASFPLTGTQFYRKLFLPGSYKLSILYDTNRNGVWDAGSYFTKPRRQPERVLFLDKTITIKENWDNETEIELLPPNND